MPNRYDQPLSAAQVEGEIRRLCDRMEIFTEQLAREAEEAGRSEAAHKAAYASAFLKAEGSVSQREQEATLQTAAVFRARKIAEAHYYSTREALGTVRAQVDALRTIAANIRGQT